MRLAPRLWEAFNSTTTGSALLGASIGLAIGSAVRALWWNVGLGCVLAGVMVLALRARRRRGR